MGKRRGCHIDASNSKRAKHSPVVPPIHQELLSLFYPNCISLRGYVLASLPPTSRLRRRKIESIGRNPECAAVETELARLLDSTLVCFHQLTPDPSDNRLEQWQSFSQEADDSRVSLSGASSVDFQCEIVDFVIWLLFQRTRSGLTAPKHLLCHGYQKNATEKTQLEHVPGVFTRNTNDQVATVKRSPWPQLLTLLGQSGQKIMINLLVDCSIFLALDAGLNNFYQLSGCPISELDPTKELKTATSSQPRKLSEITLVRSRMFYARPPMTSTGHIRSGYRHIHVLNRFPYVSNGKAQARGPHQNDINTAKVMMYMFPRQFGLHNVFVSMVDYKTTVQKFKDYTIRDEEISCHLNSDRKFQQCGLPRIPKRLRGAAQDLVRQLQIRHLRCSYYEIIRHYCPSLLDNPRFKSRKAKDVSTRPLGKQVGGKNTCLPSTQSQNSTNKSQFFQLDPSTPIVDLATPPSQVSAFLQAALLNVVPNAFWGEGEEFVHNQAVLRKKIHHLIALKRFEFISLHELSQGFKTSNLEWLHLPSQNGQKPGQQETKKRLEIFNEFLYYVFDSLLIPLARNTFYITESNNHRCQVFYFRQDMWKIVSDRAMAKIRNDMLEELCVGDLQRLENSRLGISQIRLLPKGTTLRPIINMRRRHPTKRDAKILGQSTNTTLRPIHSILKLEKDVKPSNLGATLFSVGDIYTRLKAFKSKLPNPIPPLYFVKVDVRSAFDTIPQNAVLKLMEAMLSYQEYKVLKHAEIKAKERPLSENGVYSRVDGSSGAMLSQPSSKLIRRWISAALPGDESSRFLERLESCSPGIAAGKRKNTVFINSAAQSHWTTREVLHLLAEHLTNNRIKVGKKTYRQRTGIPQGSILSSFLCNFFYADLEAKHLGFLEASTGGTVSQESLMMRLTDDFLLVTTNKAKAQRFAELLHQGVPEYGLQVKPDKSLANFALSVASSSNTVPVALSRVNGDAEFPYCGILINCRTLDISKKYEQNEDIAVSTTLTVEHGRRPGQNFERKVLHAFNLQCHVMFYDTDYNSTKTVLSTLRAAFHRSALKMWAYMRSLHRSSRPRSDLVKRAISRIAQVSHPILTSNFRKMKNEGYKCDIRKSHVSRLAYEAFEQVLTTKQAQYAQVLEWLRDEIAKCS